MKFNEFNFRAKVAFSCLACAIALGAGLAACINVFDPIDSPNNDAQYLSAARACLDDGDLKCARENYAKLTNGLADVRDTELAYAILKENDAGMDNFIAAFGSGKADVGFTKLANSLAGNAGSAKRSAILQAIRAVNTVSNQNMRNLARFVAGAALAAELLAEGTASDKQLQKTDIAVGGLTGCPVAAGCLISAQCDAGTGSLLQDGTAAVNIDTASDASISAASPNLNLVNGAIRLAVNALSALGPTGKFNTSTLQSLTTIVNTTEPTTAGTSRCYRRILIEQGIGG